MEFTKPTTFKGHVQEIIFEADTYAGKVFDVLLIASIILSVLAVMMESVSGIRANYGSMLSFIEWFFTILFTIEYGLRLYSVGRPLKYAFSFFGIIDFLAIIPTYLGLVFSGAHVLLVIRIFRVLRIFRIFKLAVYVGEAAMLVKAMRASRRKITIFLFMVSSVIVVLGSLMYLVEGEANGFTSIPQSIYWAIVTITTVGYGDMLPKSSLGQVIASISMIMGYSIIAVPTGIVTVEMANVYKKGINTQACLECSAEGHDSDARFCKYCGARL